MARNRRDDRSCRGSIYLHVLASSLLITILGLGSLLAVRIQMRSARLNRDCAVARACAASAIELGLLYVKQDSSWRTTRPNGIWLQDKQLGTGRLTLEGIDPGDGVLSDSLYEPLVLTGTGTQGAARHKTRVTLVPVIKPLEALNTCIHGSGTVLVKSGRRIAVVGAPLSSNGQLNNNGTIDGSVEVQSVAPAGDTGPLTVSAPAKPMPDASVLTQYANKARSIPFSGDIDKAVLAPGCNPWGAPDPNGLYLLDTGGSTVTIRNTRIHGTLIIRAPGKTVTLDSAMHCQNYRSNFPVLIVQGNLVINCSSIDTPLSESANGKNYNPAGAPCEGAWDDDTADTYLNEIRGLVHVEGTLTLQSSSRIVGTILCNGAITVDGTNTIIHDPSLYACPPDDYTFVDGIKISPNSWKQVVD